MPNRSYQKGTRFENKCKAWLVHLGECKRSFMSRGADLKIMRGLRLWTFSCKTRRKGRALSVNALKKECEKHDFALLGEDRDIPYIFGPLPKLIELAGENPFELPGSAALDCEYIPTGSEGC